MSAQEPVRAITVEGVLADGRGFVCTYTPEIQLEILHALCVKHPLLVVQAFEQSNPKILASLTDAGYRAGYAAGRVATPSNIVIENIIPVAAAPTVNVAAPATQDVRIISLPTPHATVTDVTERDAYGRVKKATRKPLAARA